MSVNKLLVLIAVVFCAAAALAGYGLIEEWSDEALGLLATGVGVRFLADLI